MLSHFVSALASSDTISLVKTPALVPEIFQAASDVSSNVYETIGVSVALAVTAKPVNTDDVIAKAVMIDNSFFLLFM